MILTFSATFEYNLLFRRLSWHQTSSKVCTKCTSVVPIIRVACRHSGLTNVKPNWIVPLRYLKRHLRASSRVSIEGHKLEKFISRNEISSLVIVRYCKELTNFSYDVASFNWDPSDLAGIAPELISMVKGLESIKPEVSGKSQIYFCWKKWIQSWKYLTFIPRKYLNTLKSFKVMLVFKSIINWSIISRMKHVNNMSSTYTKMTRK